MGVGRIEDIPFLPVELFKSRDVYCGSAPPEIVFSSSATTGQTPARHMMERVGDYERTLRKAFEFFYGAVENWAIFALLPGYLERPGSSLIYMVEQLGGSFYLNEYDALLEAMARETKPKLLLGVSYALWELAEQRAGRLENTVVMETGGMKGRREELPRAQFHAILQEAFGVGEIHSEYGMAELTSQAYSRGGGVFHCPPWMRVILRDPNDPFDHDKSSGAVDIIDLANRSSCAFLQTRDLGRLHPDGGFEILGRMKGSDIRGCNLLVQ